MAAQLGLNVKIMLDDAVICSGITGKKIKYNGDPVDITTDDGAGFRELLSQCDTRSIDISVEGIAKSAVIKSLILDDSRLVDGVYVLFETGERIQSTFYISGYEEDFLTAEVVKCSFDLLSSGSARLVPAWWQYVVLALRFDGVNGGTSIIDSSPLANVPATVAHAYTSTAQSAMGVSSLKSDGGSGGARAKLDYASSSNFEMRTNCTLCFWIYIPASGPSGELFLNRGDGASYWSLERHGGYAALGSANFGRYGSRGANVPYDSWHFITFCEDGVSLYFGLDGVVTSQAVGAPTGAGNRPFSVINTYEDYSLDSFSGYIDDLIFVNGYCIPEYKANFTPPTSSLIPS